MSILHWRAPRADPSLGVESEPQFAVRPVLFVEWLDPERPVGCLDSVLWEYSVLECAVVDLHAAKPASALRIASDREMCSRSAMASTAQHDLERASTAFLDVYAWPTTIAGDELDAPYAAPTSGGPPFRVYELAPVRAFAFPIADQFEPTRFTF